MGQIVNETGFPISSRTMSGSTADTDWNAKAVSYLKQLQEQGFQYGIFVADSKLVTHELVSAMNEEENPMSFVSRCPANSEGKLEERMILKAYETDGWKEMGSVSEGKKAAVYWGISFCEEKRKLGRPYGGKGSVWSRKSKRWRRRNSSARKMWKKN